MDETQRIKIVLAVHKYDKRQSTKSSYNVYAMGLYLRAVDRICDLVDSGKPLRESIMTETTGSLCAAILRSIKLPKMTDSEFKYGVG